MLSSVVIVSALQVTGDLISSAIAFHCAISEKNNDKTFFILNAIAFFVLAMGDIYYNYFFRISHANIKYSIDWVVTGSISFFQLSQAYGWYLLLKHEKTNIFSKYNVPYLLFTLTIASILIHYFIITKNLTHEIVLSQGISVTLDMFAWFFAILCLAKAGSNTIILLTLGCLMLISADLTNRCLYMFNMNKIISLQWIHLIWTTGVLVMMIGLFSYLKNKTLKLCHPESLQVSCSSWVSISSFGAFIMGFLSLTFFNFTQQSNFISSVLWYMPIPLMFTMITFVLLGNWYSNRILLPINDFLTRISAFNAGENIKEKNNIKSIKFYEFNILDNFIKNSFNQLSNQLDREIKIAEQVAHDIRSPLAVLDILIQRVPEIEEPKKILLREAINHIRDITNNLEKDASLKKESKTKLITQIASLVDHVLSERRAALSNSLIKINQNFDAESYGLFAEVIQSDMRRVLTNIINNACEAIGDNNGEIQVIISNIDTQLAITIIDNGPGISDDIINHLFTRGFTTKSKGSGLGLSYAKETLTNWGGDIELSSQLKTGTTLTIKLPLVTPPHWFVSNLSFLNSESIVCIDDNISIFHAWKEKFNALHSNIQLYYCSKKEDLLMLQEKIHSNLCTYLVDYELSGQSYTGIDLINQYLLSTNNRIILVTSRSNEKEVQDFCRLHNIFIIPKLFAFKMPISIISTQPLSREIA